MSAEDLPDHFKLEANVFAEHTLHITYRMNRTSGVREKTETQWNRVECIGEGTSGQIWRELNCQTGGNQDFRAVKVIEKQRMKAYNIDLKKKLLALAKLSKDEVLETPIMDMSTQFSREMLTYSSIDKRRYLSRSSAGSRAIKTCSLQWNTSSTATWLGTSTL